MPQERYNTECVKEKNVGIVLKSFKDIVVGVRQMLQPATLSEFRKNAAALQNRAIFEIPEILAGLLGESHATSQPAIPGPVAIDAF